MIRTATLTLCLGLLIGCGDDEASEPLDPSAESNAGHAVAPNSAATPPSSGSAVVPGSAAAPATCTASWAVYKTSPSWPAEVVPPNAKYNSDVVFADVTGDGREDMVVSSGNDQHYEVVEAYFNTGSNPPFNDQRDWISSVSGETYNGKIAVGDLEKDGCPEIVAAHFFDKAGKKMDGGGIMLYANEKMGDACVLSSSPKPIEKNPHRFTAPSLTLADVDGDADLDIVVAVATRNTGKFKPQKAEDVKTGDFSRIYIRDWNEKDLGKAFKHSASWKDNSDEERRAGDVEFADLDGDGYGDLVFATREKPRVFWGEEPSGTNADTGIRKTSCPTGKYGNGYENDLSFSVDVAHTAGKGLIAHVSASPQDSAYRPFQVFEADKNACSVTPIWSSSSKGYPSAVRFGDLLGSGALFLLAGRWADDGEGSDEGSQLRIYERASGGQFTLKACLGDDEKQPVLNGIALADLDGSCSATTTQLVDPLPDEGRLVTLDRQLVAEITGVEYDDGGWKELPDDHYAWVPGENWVSFDDEFSGKKVRIEYRTASRWDVAYGDWSPERPARIHYREGACN